MSAWEPRPGEHVTHRTKNMRGMVSEIRNDLDGNRLVFARWLVGETDSVAGGWYTLDSLCRSFEEGDRVTVEREAQRTPSMWGRVTGLLRDGRYQVTWDDRITTAAVVKLRTIEEARALLKPGDHLGCIVLGVES